MLRLVPTAFDFNSQTGEIFYDPPGGPKVLIASPGTVELWSKTGDIINPIDSANDNLILGGTTQLLNERLRVINGLSILETLLLNSGGASNSYAQFDNGVNAALSPASSARFRYNGTLNQLEVSENGGAYVPLLGAGGVNGCLAAWSAFAVGTAGGGATADFLVPWADRRATTALISAPTLLGGASAGSIHAPGSGRLRRFTVAQAVAGTGAATVTYSLLHFSGPPPGVVVATVALPNTSSTNGISATVSVPFAAGDFFQLGLQRSAGVATGAGNIVANAYLEFDSPT
jgi:hypothetical protein